MKERPVKNKNILVGVTGGIAAYKTAQVVSGLSKLGFNVKTVMTENACRFITPLTFETLSNNPVYVSMFEHGREWEIHHVSLAKWADVVLVAPATANIICKMANGLADDLLSTVLLATRKKIILCPAMNTGMLENPFVQENISRLIDKNVLVIESSYGKLACGDVGAGRMAEPEQIIAAVTEYLSVAQVLKGKKVLITAGPTREYIDPVRFLSNPSSGKMGFALARACKLRGAEVTVVSGPVSIKAEHEFKVLNVESAQEMYVAAMCEYPEADWCFCAAAVADYRPIYSAETKMKKKQDVLTIEFERTPDILAEMGRTKTNQLLIGFAAETDHLEKYAKKKLQKKNLDFIIANDVSKKESGFSCDFNQGMLYSKGGTVVALPLMNKFDFASTIITEIASQVPLKET